LHRLLGFAFGAGTNGPKLNIGSAITAASSGDVISVASGFYGLETNWDLSTKALTLLPQGQVIVYQSDPWLTFSIGDGISDGWRQYYFGSSTTTTYLSCATCDPNDNGVSNYGEFTNGTDPIVMAATAVIPTNRLIDWTQAGVPGGVPVYSTIYTTVSANASDNQIQLALNACPSGQVVLVSNGVHSVSTTLYVMNNYTVLRGYDPTLPGTNTILRGTSALGGSPVVQIGTNAWGGLKYVGTNCLGTAPFIEPGGPSSQVESVYSNNWISGYSRGSTVIYVAANSTTSSILPGMIIGLDELYDGSNVVLGAGNTTTPGFFLRECGTRPLQELKLVTAIVTNQITIQPGLWSPYWQSSQVPAVFWPYATTGPYIVGSGVENLLIDGANQVDQVVTLSMTYGCWVTHCTLQNAISGNGESTLAFNYALNCDVRHNTFDGQPVPPSSGNYAITIENASYCRIEDNIFTNYYNAIEGLAQSGCVIGYNYFTNEYSEAWCPNSGTCYTNTNVADPTDNFFPHGGVSEFNLIEGNFARQKHWDDLYGQDVYCVIYRNRFEGFDGTNNYYVPYIAGRSTRIMPESWYISAVGNVLGTSNSVFQTGPYEGPDGNEVWCFADNIGYGASHDTRVDDPRVTNTMFRQGNWDSCNGTIVWTNGFAPQAISNSLADALVGGKPAWWTNTTLTFPPFDPNTVNLTPRNLPAYYRATHNGADPP